MPGTRVRWSLVAIGCAAAAVVVWPRAYSQINASPNWVPIGVSASGSGSTVWFHEPSSRQAMACRTVDGPAGANTAVACAATRLP